MEKSLESVHFVKLSFIFESCFKGVEKKRRQVSRQLTALQNPLIHSYDSRNPPQKIWTI